MSQWQNISLWMAQLDEPLSPRAALQSDIHADVAIIGSGAGAESREAIGWVIFGGLSIAALFTLFLTPVLYLGIARLSRPRADQGELGLAAAYAFAGAAMVENMMQRDTDEGINAFIEKRKPDWI